MRIGRMAAVALLSIGMSAGALTVASPASAASRTSVNNCGQLEVKPTDLVLACADANSMLTDLRWTGWSNGRAKGVGTYEVNDCQPTCVAGKTRSYAVRVKLDQPKVQEGKRVFTRVVVAYVKASPSGRRYGAWRLPVYSAQQAAPAATAAPTASATAAPAPTATAAATPAAAPTASAAAVATPTPTPTATAPVVVAAPSATLQTSERFQTSKLRLIIAANSAAGGDRRGIRSVSVFRPNEYNAEIETKASYIGAETANQNEWSALLTCDSSGRDKDTLRIVVTANDGQTTTLREAVRPTSC